MPSVVLFFNKLFLSTLKKVHLNNKQVRQTFLCVPWSAAGGGEGPVIWIQKL